MTPPLKPEPSRATLGRAKAKGTGQDYVSPDLSFAYKQEKENYTPVAEQPADDTAAPLTPHDVLNGADPQMRRSPHR